MEGMEKYLTSRFSMYLTQKLSTAKMNVMLLVSYFQRERVLGIR